MESVFLSNLKIVKVRHLKNISIPLSNKRPKHLILTGKNGSGKTSVLEALANYLNYFVTVNNFEDVPIGSLVWKIDLKDDEIREGVVVKFNQAQSILEDMVKKGKFILAYYGDKRAFQAEKPEHIEKVKLQDKYKITDAPGKLFIKYLLDLKVTEALARNNGNIEKADGIRAWFEKFESLLQRIFNDFSLRLIFDEDTFSFFIQEDGRDVFDFYSLSSGFASALDIILDLMLRMEAHTNRTFDFDMQGIVLIDELETHLHIELQRSIMDLLTTVFPNIQFIISTHSPYVLNAVENCVVYDLDKKICMEDLFRYPAEGIVEGYFGSESYSNQLLEKVKRYEVLAYIDEPTEEERMERAKLRMDLKQLSGDLAKEAKEAFEDIEQNRRKYDQI